MYDCDGSVYARTAYNIGSQQQVLYGESLKEIEITTGKLLTVAGARPVHVRAVVPCYSRRRAAALSGHTGEHARDGRSRASSARLVCMTENRG